MSIISCLALSLVRWRLGNLGDIMDESGNGKLGVSSNSHRDDEESSKLSPKVEALSQSRELDVIL